MKRRTERLKCGCRSDDRAWLELCDEHRAEVNALHEQHLACIRARRADEERPADAHH